MIPVAEFRSHSFIGVGILAFLASIETSEVLTTNSYFHSYAEGHHLGGCLISEKTVLNLIECLLYCLERCDCRSVNYGLKGIAGGQHRCELNNCAKDDGVLLLEKQFDYYEMDQQCRHPECFAGKTCAKLYQDGIRRNGVYEIDPDGKGSFKVFCDMTGGGWTVFQRRKDGSVKFFRGWQDYKNGFGDLNEEFWLGLDRIHRLTAHVQKILRIDLEDTSGNKRFAEYDLFAVTSEREKYQLSLGNYSGNAGDSFSLHKGFPFSTEDSDNDASKYNCAQRYKGAWWYQACHESNLNGQYLNGKHKSTADGINWYAWKGHYYSLKSTSMKIRPRVCGTGKT